MSLRGFGGVTTMGASAQPCFGSVLTAKPVINPDLHTGLITAGSNRSSSVLSVTAGTASRFRVGDKVAVGAAADFEQGNTLQSDGGTVIAVNSGANTITVQGLQRQHASGEFVVLAMTCGYVGIQVLSASSTSGLLYLAEDGTAGPSSPTLLNELSVGGIFQLGPSGLANTWDTQKLWLGGDSSGAGSQYIPSFGTI